MELQRELTVALIALSTAACASISRAKGRSVTTGAAAGLFLSVLGILVVSLLRAGRPIDAPEDAPQASRMDWLTGGEGGRGASAPAILFTVLALGAAGYLVYATSAGNFNTLSPALVEKDIATDLRAKGQRGVFVDCPREMSGKPGDVHFCDVSTVAFEGQARVNVENKAGFITWTIIPR